VALDTRTHLGRLPASGSPGDLDELIETTPANALFDEVVGWRGLYAMPRRDRERLTLTLVRQATEHHVEHNRAFRAYCRHSDFEPSQLKSPADLERVPLLPSSLFKDRPDVVRSTPDSADVSLTTSSGTQGRLSNVPRDDVTLMRFFAGISGAVREMLGFQNQEHRFFNLGPPAAEDPHLWISYVMAGVGLAFRGDSYVSRGRIQLERLLRDLRRASGRYALVGPPSLIMDLVRHLEDRDPIALPPDSFVITIGGWKRRSGEEIPRPEFEERVVAALGLSGVAKVRDTFNMVELNSILFECEAKRKHAPPWLVIHARDPRTLDALPRGESGILSFVDGSALSYPAFVLSDDVGRVESGTCLCSADGDSAVIERRISSIEARGCARKMDRGDPGRRPISREPLRHERRRDTDRAV